MRDEVETPPRAWGRPDRLVTLPGGIGNTPTSVGKTCRSWYGTSARQKHPHERGEDLKLLAVVHRPRGNTPTSVGKTALGLEIAERPRKHPHERGEDIAPLLLTIGAAETPPRAWGRRSLLLA